MFVGSCGGRGPRAAGWFADFLADHSSEGIESLILTGGIKGWVAAGGEYVEAMEEHEADKWPRSAQ